MNILVLKSSQPHLDYSIFSGGWSSPVVSGNIEDYRRMEQTTAAGQGLPQRLAAIWQSAPIDSPPGVIALRGIYGGADFSEPVRITPESLRQLEKLATEAPLHIPPLLFLIQCCKTAFPHVPIVLLFETAFFVNLPMREHLYALDAGLLQSPGLRRFGFHGLLHEAAARQIARQRRKLHIHEAARLMSIVLEPRPEATAIHGQRPLTVTSGTTPLEGLPGQTNCGEIDPSIIITLAQSMSWGPEHINSILTRESGLLGLVGEPVNLKSLFRSEKPNYQPAQQLFLYRLLQACGAGIAALDGLDAIVFSGRYAEAGQKIGAWIKARLEQLPFFKNHPPAIEFCQDPLDRIMAENACATALKSRATE